MMEQKSSLDQTSSESFFFFNPRTPCGVRQTGGEITWTRCWFQSTHSLRSATQRVPGLKMFHTVSIHALLAECDWRVCASPSATKVSIHALLAECDHRLRIFYRGTGSFNPRTPCGVRPDLPDDDKAGWLFQSTHSLRSATDNQGAYACSCLVSIHALLAECDGGALKRLRDQGGFNPRTPCGVRLFLNNHD